MAKEKLSYESAFEELQSIVNAIDNESVSVDELATKVERASELIKFCSKKLRDTESAVDRIIRDMDDESPKPESKDGDLPF